MSASALRDRIRVRRVELDVAAARGGRVARFDALPILRDRPLARGQLLLRVGLRARRLDPRHLEKHGVSIGIHFS